jgi:hypothetical protein
MKYFLVIIFTFSNFILTYAQPGVTIGMTLDEVNKKYPGLKSGTYENTITLERPVNLYGLDDSWGYRFEGEKLTWIFFHKYIDELNDTNFKKCLSATRSIIKDFTQLYGKPDSTITGDTTFIDPYKKMHYGYDVMEVRWKDVNGMKIKVEFTFMGGKGEYHLLVTVNYFGKYYPYFE